MGVVGRNELGSSASGLLSLQAFLVLQNERHSGIGSDLASVSSSESKNRLRPLVMSRRRKQRTSSRWGAAAPALMDDHDLKHLVLLITS
jgi:hypothetical protein